MGLRIGLVTVAGLVAYALLFIQGPGEAVAAPLSLAVGAVAILLAIELGTRRLDTRTLALLAALAALDSGLRLALVNGVAGFSPIFLLILCSGFVFGPTFGFLTGALSLLVSALVTGGVGPWVPYEMFGCGWVGAVAGFAGAARSTPPGRRDLVVLAAAGLVLGYAYGAVIDLFDWAVFYRGIPGIGWVPGVDAATALRHYTAFYLETSAVWDTFRAAGNVVMVLVLGAPLIAALSRFNARFSLVIEAPGGPASAET